MPRERKGSVKNKNNNCNNNNDNDNEVITKTTNKKRRTSNANNNNSNNNNNNQNNNNNNNGNNVKALELIPPQPISTFGDTIIASNPFDDTPHTPQSQQNTPQSTSHSPNNMIITNTSNPSMTSMVSQSQTMQTTSGPQPQPKPVTLMSGKTYPPEQSMVFNPANPNAPPIYPCGVCHKEVHDNDQAILCESGCNFWFHRACTGLSERAYFLLHHEIYAEWVCNKCTGSKNIPLIKLKP